MVPPLIYVLNTYSGSVKRVDRDKITNM